MLNNEQKKRLTEYLGECWNEYINNNFLLFPTKCGEIGDLFNNFRTFTTDTDFLALCRKAVEKGEWAEFWEFAERKELCSGIVTHDEFAVWLFLENQKRSCELFAEWLGDRNDSRND